MRDIELFSPGAIYHVYNRGVDKRNLFLDAADRARFVKSLVAFNDVGRRKNSSLSRVMNPTVSDNPCVNIVAYCLMPNHFHLMLQQVADRGVSEFMHRLGLGYTKYFNKRHERVGRLLESAYKIKRVETTIQQRHLSRYIHLNPLELGGMNWKERKILWGEAEPFLQSYLWSSYRHYAGMEAKPFVRVEEGLKYVGGSDGYTRFLAAWIERDWPALDAFDCPIPGVG